MYSPADAALEHAGRAGEEPDLVDHRRHLLRPGQPGRLAGVLDLGGDQLLGARLERVGDAQQRELALGRCRVAPRLERRGGRRMAASTSAADRTPALPRTASPVAGSMTSVVRPSAASTCWPLTKLRSVSSDQRGLLGMSGRPTLADARAA